MFVICFGAKKTGSTITFQLVSALLEARGFDQTSIPRGAIDHGRVQNFSPECWANDHDWVEFLASHSSHQHLYAIKFHGPCTARLATLINEGKILAIVNTRDPRDTALSLRDVAIRKKSGAFSALKSPRSVFDAVKAGCNRTYGWLRDGALIADYEQVAFDSAKFLARVATYLEVDVPSIEEARSMRDRADRASGTRNLMRSRRFLHDWTTGQAAFYTELFAAEIEQLSAISGASEAGIFYPEIRVKNTIGQLTERTFVVLGCPRGGTSLLAGALHATGINMGGFKTAQYEDKSFKIPPAEAKCDPNIESRLLPLIQERNSRHRLWGWKVPNAIYYINQIQHLLINPVFLFIYRDEEAIARSSAKHDRKAWWLHRRRLLEVARNHTKLVRDFEASLGDSAAKAVFRVEEIRQDIPNFLDHLETVLAPDKLDREAVRDFVSPSGGYVPPRA